MNAGTRRFSGCYVRKAQHLVYAGGNFGVLCRSQNSPTPPRESAEVALFVSPKQPLEVIP